VGTHSPRRHRPEEPWNLIPGVSLAIGALLGFDVERPFRFGDAVAFFRFGWIEGSISPDDLAITYVGMIMSGGPPVITRTGPTPIVDDAPMDAGQAAGEPSFRFVWLVRSRYDDAPITRMWARNA
jgi:hypothetical protein